MFKLILGYLYLNILAAGFNCSAQQKPPTSNNSKRFAKNPNSHASFRNDARFSITPWSFDRDTKVGKWSNMNS